MSVFWNPGKKDGTVEVDRRTTKHPQEIYKTYI